MAALLLIGAVLAHPPAPSLTADLGGDLSVGLSATLGARWAAHVGDEAALARLDPLALAGVSVYPLGATLSVSSGAGYALLRVEEGHAHAGSLEAAEARLGADVGWGGVWLGRGDLPVTRDRAREMEDRPLTIAPLLSRAYLPQHAAGAAATARWPERGELSAGLSWPTATADGPYTWGRLTVHPLGEPPADEAAEVRRLTPSASAGALEQRSPSLGTRRLLSADAELRWRGWGVTGGWIQYTDPDDTHRQWLAAAWGPLVPLGERQDIHAYARVEHLLDGIVEDEDGRWLAAARLAWRREQATLYVEGLRSREQGLLDTQGDIVVINPQVEWANDILMLGARWRL